MCFWLKQNLEKNSKRYHDKLNNVIHSEITIIIALSKVVIMLKNKCCSSISHLFKSVSSKLFDCPCTNAIQITIKNMLPANTTMLTSCINKDPATEQCSCSLRWDPDSNTVQLWIYSNNRIKMTKDWLMIKVAILQKWDWLSCTMKFIYNTHTHTTVLQLCGICPGKPGWAGTRRNIHPLLSS